MCVCVKFWESVDDIERMIVKHSMIVEENPRDWLVTALMGGAKLFTSSPFYLTPNPPYNAVANAGSIFGLVAIFGRLLKTLL